MSTYNEFLFYSKQCSSKMALQYVRWKNAGKDVSKLLIKICLLNSYIKTVECGKQRKYYGGDCEPCLITVQSCLNKEDICKFVEKIKSICNC